MPRRCGFFDHLTDIPFHFIKSMWPGGPVTQFGCGAALELFYVYLSQSTSNGYRKPGHL